MADGESLQHRGQYRRERAQRANQCDSRGPGAKRRNDHRDAAEGGRIMIVAGTDLASELRRRRLGRPELRECLSRTPASAWVPGAHLHEAPSELLMLAALSLADAVASPMQQSCRSLTRGAPPEFA
jgi:hypothetical protein